MSDRQSPFEFFSLVRIGLVGLTVVFFVWITFAGLSAERQIRAIQSGDLDPVRHGHQLLSSTTVTFPKEWIETARQVSTQSSQNDALAISLLEKSVAADRDNYEAWSLLAFLYSRSQGSVSDSALQALNKSFETCPLCNKDILKWRLTFVLAHWDAMDESAKLAAFEGADILRWWYLEYGYLGQVRAEAQARNIPFDAYRKKVGTPVRPNEIGLPDD